MLPSNLVSRDSRRSIRNTTLGVVVIAVLALVGCSSDEASSGESAGGDDFEPIVLTATDFSPEHGTTGTGLLAFQEKVGELSDGRITFENYYSGSLLGQMEMLEGVGSGVADIGIVGVPYFPGELPVSSWIAEMGSYVLPRAVHSAYAGMAASYISTVSNPAVTEEFESFGVTPLASYVSMPFSVLCTKPFRSPDETDGIRSRSSSPVHSAEFEAVGITPVTVDYAEQYEALQRGVVDCSSGAGSSYETLGLPEIAKYYVPLNLSYQQAHTYVINSDKWNSLPAPAQEILHEASYELAFSPMVRTVELQVDFAKNAQEAGVEAIDPEPFRADIKAQQQKVLDAMIASAPAQIEDPEAFIDEYIETLHYWRDALIEEGIGATEPDPSELFAEEILMGEVDLDGFTQKFRDEVVATTGP